MFGKLMYFISFILVFGLCTGTVVAELVAYYPLNEGSGSTTVDASGNGHEGTINGGPEWITGKFGKALEFSGASGGHVNLGTWDPSEGTNQLSFGLWVKWNGLSGEWQGLISKRDAWDPAPIGEMMWFLEANQTTGIMWFGRREGGGVGGTSETLPVGEWQHIAVTCDGTTATFYRDGVQVNSGGFTLGSKTDAGLQIGSGYRGGVGPFNGAVDDVRIYNHALSAEEIQDAMMGAMLRAYGPIPADGSIHEDTWVSMSWTQGTSAASHDVYFGDNFDDVNNSAESTFQGNQATTFLVVGFPGFAFPDGLVNGTTYYWRIDEVEANGATVHKGDVWSFTVPPKIAYTPNPPNGAKFVDPNTNLSWDAGFGTKVHYVYFGDNYDDVNNAAGGLPGGTKTFTPGTLELDKIYYWRVDEFDGLQTYKGDIWSFRVAKVGGGVRADYYKGMNFEELVLNRVDPQIDFNWSSGAPDESVGEDGFSVRWSGQVEAAFTETYTFYTRTDEGVRFWVEGRQLVDNWVDRSPIEDKAAINLIAGQIYGIVMEYYENEGGAVAELRWSSQRTPKQIIPQAALSLPVMASGANPMSGSSDLKQDTVLTWGAGDFAESHEVYFGTDEEAVRNADPSSPEYKGTRALGSESYDPGVLQWDTTYYWRVDEINNNNPGSPWVGGVWSFTTANFLIVDDIEAYNDIDPAEPDSNRIYLAWVDGFDNPAANGSIVGYANAPFAEKTIVHGGSQSMPFSYDNSVGKSEATLALTYPRDWTANNINTLTIWFRGNPAGLLEEPAGTFTMTASGADIWNQADEFRYAYKQLAGAGSISARVLSVQNTDNWAKIGVMIRESLNPSSKFAAVYLTPGNGCRFQGRLGAGADAVSDTDVETSEQTAITAPYWVKIDRDAAGNFNGYYSADGINWRAMSWNPQRITMAPNVYIGLALTSHNSGVVCEAQISDIQTNGVVSPLVWTHEAIGAAMASNEPEPMYVALNDNAVVTHDNPNAALINNWTQWNIDLMRFADQGVNLANVNTITLGFGDRNNPQPGGSGMMYFDDIRLYAP
ncbi:MAG: hypothetical protein ISS76_14360 [Phycisphaerae bacterium]|nr:hypothetical protein [Phycisphaerae bacterium]